MPMDLRASVVHRLQRKSTVDQMVESPRIARSVARPAATGGEIFATRGAGKEKASAAGRVDIALSKFQDPRSTGVEKARRDRTAAGQRALFRAASLDAGARGSEEGSCGAYDREHCRGVFRGVDAATLGVEREGDGEEKGQAEKR